MKLGSRLMAPVWMAVKVDEKLVATLAKFRLYQTGLERYNGGAMKIWNENEHRCNKNASVR